MKHPIDFGYPSLPELGAPTLRIEGQKLRMLRLHTVVTDSRFLC